MTGKLPWHALFDAAERARLTAYAPYSNFRVGAAVLAEDGSIFSGGNVENASYGLSLCAERNAVARAVLEGKKRLIAAAVAVDSRAPAPPCGMCRQTLSEFAGGGLEIRSRTLDGQELATTLGELLPHAFSGAFLKGSGG